MNFKELQAIVSYLKQFSTCPGCNRKFGDRHLKVLGTVQNSAFFNLDCPECSTTGILGVFINKECDEHGVQKRFFEIRHMGSEERVTADEVLDMRNFLDSLKGDLTKYLT